MRKIILITAFVFISSMSFGFFQTSTIGPQIPLITPAGGGSITIVNSAKATAAAVSASATITLAAFNITAGTRLVIAVPQEYSSTDPDIVPTCVFNTSESLTRYAASTFYATGNNNRTDFFELGSPTNTTADIVCTNNENAASTMQIYAWSLTGAAAASAGANNNSASSDTVSQSVTTTSNNSLILSVLSEGTGTTMHATTPYGAGQTEAFKDENILTTCTFASTTETLATAGADTQSFQMSASTNRMVTSIISFPPQ